jgi:FemAB-related protein (PEP-CTERM system-associated)
MSALSVAHERIPSAPSRMSSIVEARDQDATDWNAFVETCPDATGYHEWNWRHVFQTAFGHRCVYLIARFGDEIRGVMPLVQINSRLFGRTLTSLPFLNYGGVLAADEATGQALLDAAAEVARAERCRHVELRHVGRLFPALPCRQHKVTMLLPLVGVDWSSLDKKVRNQIRKAEKSGLVMQSGGAELLDDFYTVFARNMRDLGTPVYGRALFEQVLLAFPGRAHVHVVRLGTTPVACGFTFRSRARLEIPWASSVRDYNALCPNFLLYWSLIQYAIETGCEIFDFGRSTPGEGTFKFKEQWGAQPVPLHWEYLLNGTGQLPDTSPDNPKYALLVNAWQRLPVPVATLIGPHIVRAIP